MWGKIEVEVELDLQDMIAGTIYLPNVTYVPTIKKTTIEYLSVYEGNIQTKLIIQQTYNLG